MLILLVFKKYKNRKIQNLQKKERKLSDQFWGPNNILSINIGQQTHTKGGAILQEKKWEQQQT